MISQIIVLGGGLSSFFSPTIHNDKKKRPRKKITIFTAFDCTTPGLFKENLSG